MTAMMQAASRDCGLAGERYNTSVMALVVM